MAGKWKDGRSNGRMEGGMQGWKEEWKDGRRNEGLGWKE